MNYADLTATQRDTLLALVAIERIPDDTPEAPADERPEPRPIEPTPTRIHGFHEENFGPISKSRLSGVLADLVDASLSVKQRSESDGRVWIYRSTEAGHETLHRAIRERQRWIKPPEPRPDHESQLTLAEVVAR